MEIVDKNEPFRNEYMVLGLKISYYRHLAGLTQEGLAEAADISLSMISQIEANNRKLIKGITLTTLFKIARALNISPSKLLEE